MAEPRKIKKSFAQIFFLQARNYLLLVDPDASSDDIKEFRDSKIFEWFGKESYKDLTTSQLTKAEQKFHELNGRKIVRRKVYPSKSQTQTYYMLAFRCAVYYMDWETMQFLDKGTGEMMTGERLRNYVGDILSNEDGSLPKQIVTALFTHWINRRSNQFLSEAGLKVRGKITNTNYLYTPGITKEQMECLIPRWRQMYLVKNSEIKPANFSQEVMSN